MRANDINDQKLRMKSRYDPVYLYQEIKVIFDKIDKTNKTKDQLGFEVKSRFLSSAWSTFRAYRPRYSRMGFKSKEMEKLDQMIENVVEGFDLEDSGLADFESVIRLAETHVSAAIKINKDCKDIVNKLNQIPNFLDTGKWENVDS